MEPILRPGEGESRGITDRPVLLGAISVAAIGLFALLDVLTGTEISLTTLYLIPVAVMAWSVGLWSGRALAVLAAVAVLGADLVSRGLTASTLPTVWNALAVLALSLGTVEILTRLRRALDSERDLARTDALTGAANSRSFGEAAALELERVARHGGTFTVAYLDLDHFKLVNDTLGHDTGDRLLRDVARSLKGRLRKIDTIARLGGDEFIVLLPATDEKAAAVVLASVRQALLSLTEAYGPGVRASIGAVTFTEPPESVDEMLRVADTTMYRAKYAGRDRVETLTMPEDAHMLSRG